MSLEERVRQAADNILGDESLGADLVDEQAQVLLDWGLNLAERVVRSTQALDEGQASAVIDEGLYALRRTMRRVGKLVGNLNHMEAEAAQERLSKILNVADQLPGVQVHAPADLQAELETLRGLPTGEALQRVLTWFKIGEEGEHGA